MSRMWRVVVIHSLQTGQILADYALDLFTALTKQNTQRERLTRTEATLDLVQDLFMLATQMMRNQVILAEAMLSDQEQDHYTVRKGKETLVGYVFLQSLLSKDLKDTQAHGPKRILQVRK